MSFFRLARILYTKPVIIAYNKPNNIIFKNISKLNVRYYQSCSRSDDPSEPSLDLLSKFDFFPLNIFTKNADQIKIYLENSLNYFESFYPTVFSIALPFIAFNTLIKYIQRKRIDYDIAIRRKTISNYQYIKIEALTQGDFDKFKTINREERRFNIRTLAPSIINILFELSKLYLIVALRVAIATVDPSFWANKSFLWIFDLTQPDPTTILPLSLSSFILYKCVHIMRKQNTPKWRYIVPVGICSIIYYKFIFVPANFLAIINVSLYASELIYLLLSTERAKKLFGFKDIKITHDDLNIKYDSLKLNYIKSYMDNLNLDYSTMEVSDKYIDLKRNKLIYDDILNSKREEAQSKEKNTSDSIT